MVSHAGEIVTAYHVIYGAQRIDVSWGNRTFKDVMILRIRPDRDLAVLQIVNPPADMQPLRVTKQNSKWAAGQSIEVIGHPRGMPLEQFNGAITQKGYLLSEQLRNDQGRSLFREDGVRLVPADVTIYNGLSGGPILLGGEVIGILSGSLEVGRGISWGIPTDYLQSMQEVGRRAGEMNNWPDFAMTANWSNVRSTYRLNAGVQQSLDEYFDRVDQLDKSDEDLLVNLHNAHAGLILAIQLFTPPSNTPEDANWWPGEMGEQFVETQLVPSTKKAMDSFKRSAEIEGKVRYALGRLLSEKKEQYTGLPRTVKNLKALDDTDAAEAQIVKRYDKVNKESIQDALGLTDLLKAKRPVGEIPSEGRSLFAGTLRKNWQLMDHLIGDQLQFKAADQRNARIQEYRDIGKVFEQVFYRDMDLTNDGQQYHSTLGYTIMMPRGWVQVSQELLQLDEFHKVKVPAKGDLFFLKTGFFGDGRNSNDMIGTAQFRTSDPSSAPWTDEELEQNRGVLLTRGLNHFPDFRDFSIQRATFISLNGALARGVWGPEGALSHYQQAFISLPNRLFSVECYIYPGGDPAECDAVFNSVQFE